jgi:transcription initiation factor TFIIIB Brf1 subunit/transcription initiation factor TFIIB
MSENPDKLRERIERYRSLLALNPDADVRKIIDVLLKEAEEQLASVSRQPGQDSK